MGDFRRYVRCLGERTCGALIERCVRRDQATLPPLRDAALKNRAQEKTGRFGRDDRIQDGETV
jgi:hypothetical protein